MTRKEMEKLYLIPLDIRKRRERIDRLSMLIADNEVSDVVQSSTDMGAASTIGHATIRGIASMQNEREQLKKLKSELLQKNEQLLRDYPVAVRMIEDESDPSVRSALHMRLLEGYEYKDIASITNHGSADSWQKVVSKWLDVQFK